MRVGSYGKLQRQTDPLGYAVRHEYDATGNRTATWDPKNQTTTPLYRLRTGDCRVLYRVDETLVTVMRVINRKDLERALRRLGLPRR